MGDMVAGGAIIDINPSLDIEKLRGQFRCCRRLHVPNFVAASQAQELYEYLASKTSWRTFAVANEQLLGTMLEGQPLEPWTSRREIENLAHEGIRAGFASVFDADHPLVEDGGLEDGTVLDVLRSHIFIQFARAVTGIESLMSVKVQACRFRQSHFVGFHDAAYSADASGKRRVNFELNLTPAWRPEWGGMLEFRGSGGLTIEGIMPCFNSLVLYGFPQGSWISVVADFAEGPRYAISGSFYSN